MKRTISLRVDILDLKKLEALRVRSLALMREDKVLGKHAPETSRSEMLIYAIRAGIRAMDAEVARYAQSDLRRSIKTA